MATNRYVDVINEVIPIVKNKRIANVIYNAYNADHCSIVLMDSKVWYVERGSLSNTTYNCLEKAFNKAYGWIYIGRIGPQMPF